MKKRKHKDGANILSEFDTRKSILNMAERFNCKEDVIAILDKYDRALKNCTNIQERKYISACGAAELHKYFYCKGNLIVDGKEILSAESGYTDDGKIIKS